MLIDLAGFSALGKADVSLAEGISRDAARLAAIEEQVRQNRAETEKFRRAAAKQKAALDAQVKLLEAAKVRLAQAIAAQKKAITAQQAAMDRVLNDKEKLAAAVAALKAEEAQVKSIVDRLLKQQFGSSLPILYQEAGPGRSHAPQRDLFSQGTAIVRMFHKSLVASAGRSIRATQTARQGLRTFTMVLIFQRQQGRQFMPRQRGR